MRILPVLLVALCALEAPGQETGPSVVEASGAKPTAAVRTTSSELRASFYSFERADIRLVVRALARLGGAEVELDPEVQGEVTLRARGICWRDVLTAAVETLGFVVREDESGMLRVGTPAQVPEPEAEITMSFENTDVRRVIDAITALADAAVVLAPSVRGQVTLRLQSVPWRDALAAAVRAVGCVVEEDRAGILRIR